MRLYIRLLCYVKPYLLRLITAAICTTLAAVATLYIPRIVGSMIDDVLASKDLSALNLIVVAIVLLYTLKGVFFYGQTYLMSYVGQRVVIDIRAAIYRHLQRLSLSYFESRQTGAIMSYITNDVGALQSGLVENAIDAITESTVLVGSIAFMFYIDWKLSLLTFVSLPLIAHAIKTSGRRLRSASRTIQERASDISSVLQESVLTVRVVQSFVRENYEIERFNRENQRNFQAIMKNVQLMATLTPVIEFLAAISVTIIIWYGGREVINGNLTSGALISFIMYISNFSNPMKRLSRIYGNIQRALAAAQRIFDVLDTQPEIKDPPGAAALPPITGSVAFSDVTFEYKPGEPALINVSFEGRPGQMVAIVGPSGAGKTTIANLIPRFYDPTGGCITIDGIDIKTVTLESLRRQIGMVPQETLLFNGTVYDNILYGNLDAADEAVTAAAKAANAHDFITAMPLGYDTQIGERGAKLSGGQRQRIAIARAILKNPQVLILDEATSALDAESEVLVQEALDKLMLGRTSFVIAHRLSTVQRADLILVMDKGRIVERGKHKDLIRTGGLYSKLYHIGFNTDSAASGD